MVLNEAAGYLGSKFVDPGRTTPDWTEIVELGLSRPQFGLGRTERAAFNLAARHLRAEFDPERSRDLQRVYRSRPAAFVGSAHLLGYALGERLWRGLRDERLTDDYARCLFGEDWSEPGTALRRYLLLRADLAELA